MTIAQTLDTKQKHLSFLVKKISIFKSFKNISDSLKKVHISVSSILVADLNVNTTALKIPGNPNHFYLASNFDPVSSEILIVFSLILFLVPHFASFSLFPLSAFETWLEYLVP